MEKRIVDCTQIKSPLGTIAVGPSPVDRRKQGTKRSIVTDGDGILLACVLAPGNRNEAKLLQSALEAVPSQYQSKKGKDEVLLDAIYNTQDVRTICF
ncbi:MAG TPA: transposase, partial [Candidatus Bathyarchaeia archaeon]|nr:transposase [Candidatus Bathyarchaeia archaeon]